MGIPFVVVPEHSWPEDWQDQAKKKGLSKPRAEYTFDMFQVDAE